MGSRSLTRDSHSECPSQTFDELWELIVVVSWEAFRSRVQGRLCFVDMSNGLILKRGRACSQPYSICRTRDNFRSCHVFNLITLSRKSDTDGDEARQSITHKASECARFRLPKPCANLPRAHYKRARKSSEHQRTCKVVERECEGESGPAPSCLATPSAAASQRGPLQPKSRALGCT